MKKLSVKNLVLGCISLSAAVLMLVGLAFSGGFNFRFYGLNIINSIVDILALLAAVVFIVLNIVMLAMGKVSPKVGLLTIIVATAIAGYRFILSIVIYSVMQGRFYFSATGFVALLLTEISLVAYFVCKACIDR